jgi:hypothetical protein
MNAAMLSKQDRYCVAAYAAGAYFVQGSEVETQWERFFER